MTGRNFRTTLAASALALSLALGLTLGLAGAALAQPMMQGQQGRGPGQGMMQQGQGMMQGYGPGQGMMYGQGYGPGYGMGGHGMMMGMMGGGYTEGSVAFLKAELGITAQQEAVWKPFAEALRSFGATMHGPRTGRQTQPQPQAQTLPDSLQARVGWMEGHLAALKTLSNAAKPFYAALTPEQKTRADDLLGGCPCLP